MRESDLNASSGKKDAEVGQKGREDRYLRSRPRIEEKRIDGKRKKKGLTMKRKRKRETIQHLDVTVSSAI